MNALVVLAFVVGATPQAAVSQATSTVEALAVLERDPRELPAAQPGRWTEWTPESAVPAALHPVLARAGAAYERGDVPLALTKLYEALALDPDYPPALHQMGVLYFRLQRYGDTVFVFERFLAVAPTLVGQTRALAHGLYSLGEYERARQHYGRVLAVEPDDVEALRGQGLARMRMGDAEGALSDLEQVLVRAPEHVDAAIWVARILYDQERLEPALAAAELARDLDPYRPQAWFVLGQVLFELERDEQAAEARRRFEELDRVAQEVRILEHRLLYDPTQRDVLVRLAQLFHSIGDIPRTRSALARAVRVAPKDVELRIFALDALVSMGDAEGAALAAEAMERACAQEPEIWRRLERYYMLTRERLRQVQAGERYRRLSGQKPPPIGD